jgi:ABC-type sulfate transport system substrate-binding protein
MFKLMAKINSKAKTLKGINTAIEKEFGDQNLCYENEAALSKAEKEGFIKVNANSIEIWEDRI